MDNNDLKAEIQRLKDTNNKLTDLLDRERHEAALIKNRDFVQLYKQELMELRALNSKDSGAMSILLLLVQKMDKQNALVISQKHLQAILGKSRATISKSIKALKEANFIDVVKVGNANVYIVNSNVFWQDDAVSKEKTTVFTATVIASGEEQEKGYFENWKGVKLKKVPMLYGETPISAPEEGDAHKQQDLLNNDEKD